MYIHIPGTQMSSIFEGQAPKTRPKLQSKQGSSKGSRYMYIYIYHISSLTPYLQFEKDLEWTVVSFGNWKRLFGLLQCKVVQDFWQRVDVWNKSKVGWSVMCGSWVNDGKMDLSFGTHPGFSWVKIHGLQGFPHFFTTFLYGFPSLDWWCRSGTIMRLEPVGHQIYWLVFYLKRTTFWDTPK